jgi:hypothetical protein
MIKPGVDIAGIRPEMALAYPMIQYVFHKFGSPCVITSSKEGKHMIGSLHYVGQALDFRSRNIAAHNKGGLIAALREALGSQFDIVDRKTHIHIEFQPK